MASGSGEEEPAPRGQAGRSPRASGSDETEPAHLGVGRDGDRGLEVGRGGARPQSSGEAEPAHMGVDWSCSHALDCSDESMLMTISSSSGTLVLVPDTLRPSQTPKV